MNGSSVFISPENVSHKEGQVLQCFVVLFWGTAHFSDKCLSCKEKLMPDLLSSASCKSCLNSG